MKKFDVLFISNFEPPYRVEFYNEFSKYCNVTVALSDSKEQHTDRNQKWFTDQKYDFKVIRLKQVKLKNFHICPEITAIIREGKYDFIIVDIYSTLTAMYAIHYMKKCKIPFVISADGGFVKSGKGIKEKIKKYFLGAASYYFSTGKATDQYLMFYGAEKEKIFHTPITTLREEDIIERTVTREEKNKLRKELGIKEDRVLLFVGNLIYRKGIDILLYASNKLDKQIGVYIIGGKPPAEYLQIQRELNLTNVHFVDFKEKEKLFQYYAASDIFVFPTRTDIWGLVINEAFAKGLPVITTENCIAGIELIENGVNGYLIPSDNSEMLRDSIQKLLADDDLISKMGANNIEKIKWYTIENQAKTHYEGLVEILERESRKK